VGEDWDAGPRYNDLDLTWISLRIVQITSYDAASFMFASGTMLQQLAMRIL
jgi:hypothetical protein